jgi:hypothetical protein
MREGKLCRFDYTRRLMYARRNSEALGDLLDYSVLVFDTSPNCYYADGGPYSLDTVFVLLGCEKSAWKVLTPDGLVGVVYNGSYDIIEVP